jgi:hypothetical protein
MLPDNASQPVAEEGTGWTTPYPALTEGHAMGKWIVQFPVDF